MIATGGLAGRLTRPKVYPTRSLTKSWEWGEPFTAGPFIGMRDALDPAGANPHLATLLQNVYPLDPVGPAAGLLGRPGFDQAGAQGGDTNKRTGQLVTQFTTLAGVQYTVRIVGGQGIQTYDWSAEAWTTVVTVANLTTASITLSETARCTAVPFTNKLHIHDGVNVPFLWDGSSGSGGLTELTNSPVLYGPQVVYYAKIFGIKDTARSTIVYSEENDATLGYDTAPYSNVWTVGQTDQDALFALAATNDALYLLRANSITTVTGAVTPDFVSSGVRDSCSETIGTLSPWSVYVHDDSMVFFLDALGRPQVILGGKLLDPPLWRDFRETCVGVDPAAASLLLAETWYDPETRLICMGVVEIGQSLQNAILCFLPTTLQAAAVFRGYTFNRMGVVINASGRQVLMHLSSDGYAYDHGAETGVLWDDELNAGTEAIVHVVESPVLGYDPFMDKRWKRGDFVFRTPTDMTVTVTYATSRGQSDAASLTPAVAGGYARWDYAVWDTDVWAGTAVESKETVGWNGFGRWLKWRLQHQVAAEQFGFVQGTAWASPMNLLPQAP